MQAVGCRAQKVGPRSDCNLLRLDRGVQLIVFFAAISGTLKSRIYGLDNICLASYENKRFNGMLADRQLRNREFAGFDL